ncbi:MAG: hypothetical protein RLT05_25550, partial [Bauldia litoralis]
MIRRFLVFLTLVAGICAPLPILSGAQAQMPGMSTGKPDAKKAVVPKDLTPAQVDKLLSRLTDAQVRDLLKERLDAVA